MNLKSNHSYFKINKNAIIIFSDDLIFSVKASTNRY